MRIDHPHADQADTPEAREARILAHIAHYEHLGLRGVQRQQWHGPRAKSKRPALEPLVEAPGRGGQDCIVARAEVACRAEGVTLAYFHAQGRYRGWDWTPTKDRIIHRLRRSGPVRPGFMEMAAALGMSRSAIIKAFQREERRLAESGPRSAA